MTCRATVRRGDALVVFEGKRRILCRRTASGYPSPTGLWPRREDIAFVREHVRDGRPLLIVLSDATATVSVFREQYIAAPAEVRALGRDDGTDLIDIEIPALDWLPEAMRQRGLAFVMEAKERALKLPALMRPPLALSEPDPDQENVRFAHILAPCPPLETGLESVSNFAFTRVQGRAA